MSTRKAMLTHIAAAVAAVSTLLPGDASAFGRGHATAAPVRVITSMSAPSVRYGYRSGWGYGAGWCYWHPYVCYRR